MKRYFLLFTFFVLIHGCDTNKREEALQEQQRTLDLKEQELNTKEKTLAEREQQLLAREVKADSTRKPDSVNANINLITGKWSVKMTCIQTTCSGSAIGDTKSEQWIISSQGGNVIARAMAGENLIRIYNGNYSSEILELKEDRPATAEQPGSKTKVNLKITTDNTMEGEREILRDQGCRTLFSIRLEKQL